jgi:hypothetical protein
VHLRIAMGTRALNGPNEIAQGQRSAALGKHCKMRKSCRDEIGSTLGSSQQVALSCPYRTYLRVGFTQGCALLAMGYLILPLQAYVST